MPDNEEATGSRSPFTEPSKPKRDRISQACEACRTQKARCRPSNVPGTCEKCLKAKKNCVPHIPKTASSVGRGKRRSLAKMESRIEALYQLLNKASPEDQRKFREAEATIDTAEDDVSDDEPAQASRPLFETWYNTPPTEHGDNPQATATPLDAAPTLAEEWRAQATRKRPKHFPSMATVDASPTVSESAKLVNKLIITLGWPHLSNPENYFKVALLLGPNLTELLDNFHLLVPYFPFLQLPPEGSHLDLVMHRPLLTAAMLVVASSHSRPLQTACDDLFKNALATKALVLGEKSLDVLQALQVYIAFHQHYWDLATQQIPLYINLAITIALELGFDASFKYDVRKTVSPEALNIAGLRSLLGCYYLSTLQTGLGFNKAQALSWSSTLERCAAEVAAHGTLEHDQYMPGMVSLLHIAEDIKASLRIPASATPFPLREDLLYTTDNDIRTALSYSHLEHRLRRWDVEFPTKDLTWLTPTRHFLSIYLFESALLPSNAAGGGNNSTTSQRHLDLLAACLSAARLFLDGVLASPTLVLDKVNVGVWTHLLGAVMTVTRLSRPLPPELAKNVFWDHVAAANAVNISQYNDALVQRMREQALHRPANQQRVKIREFFEMVSTKIADTVFVPEEARGEMPDGALFDNVRHYAMKPRNTSEVVGNIGLTDDETFWSGFMGLGWMGDLGM